MAGSVCGECAVLEPYTSIIVMVFLTDGRKVEVGKD
jgi:hypothetical protein